MGIILIVLIFVFVRFWRRRKRQSRRANVTAGIANDGNEVFLNLLKSDKHNYKADNMLKKNDLMNKNKVPPSPRPPPVPDRPISYTPSNRDSLQTLNNFDSLRNEEHQPNIPAYNLEYLQTFSPPRSVASVAPILPPPPPANFSDTDSIQKEPWEYACQNILQNYMTGENQFTLHIGSLFKQLDIVLKICSGFTLIMYFYPRDFCGVLWCKLTVHISSCTLCPPQTGPPWSGKNICKVSVFPGQGKVGEFCRWPGKFRKDLES